MDETALLAMAILLEEVAKESLGETGDLVFVEGEKEASDSDPVDVGRAYSQSRRRVRASSSAAQRSGQTREAKRQKLKHESEVA